KPPLDSLVFVDLLYKECVTTFFHTSIITKNPPLGIDVFFAPLAKILKVLVIPGFTTPVI
ncbi:TPA: hypothetical protein ACU6U6_002498, partial [Enterococcus faecalis]|uniref:hypothetical protein n=1 Tax=Enterococcus faecalis TaxID=1351 RepID=UPI0034D36EBF